MLLHGILTQFGNVLCREYKGAKAETSIFILRIVCSGKLTAENTGRSIATVKDKELKKSELVTNIVKMQGTKSVWSVRVKGD